MLLVVCCSLKSTIIHVPWSLIFLPPKTWIKLSSVASVVVCLYLFINKCFQFQVQLVRIHLRVPEYGWTTQKVFHLMNFVVNGCKVLHLLFSSEWNYYKPSVSLLAKKNLHCDSTGYPFWILQEHIPSQIESKFVSQSAFWLHDLQSYSIST